MLKDRMTSRTRTRLHKHTDGSDWFKSRRTDIKLSTDEAPDQNDVSIAVTEYFTLATERGHTGVDIHTQHSTDDTIRVFDLEDGVLSISVANVTLFVTREQYAKLQAAMKDVS